MKDANEMYRAGVNLRELGDNAKLWQPKLPARATTASVAVVKAGPELILRNAADIQPEAIDWIWQDRIARGKQTAIAGEPGLGKSQVGVFVASTLTVGGDWPNGEGKAPRGRVIILSAEDSAEDTIVPRLIAAGADRSLVSILHAVEEQDGKGRRTFNLQTDLHLLESKIKRLGDVQLVLIDPISAYFGKGVDGHKDIDVRTVLAPVTDMASQSRVAILTVAHFNKGGGHVAAKALHKFMGSIAFVAAPRVAFAVIEDPEDGTRRLFLHAKNNLAPPPPGLTFRVEKSYATLLNEGISTSSVIWGADSISMTADEAVAATKSKVSAPTLEEAKDLLRGLIGSDGMNVKDIEKEAKDAGISWATVRRAKDELGLKSGKDGLAGGWLWKK
jgi:putative DNA primase/helicase